jgi:sugar phosphate isomerase/epimerase
MKLGINTYTFMWAIGFEGARPEKPLTALGLLEQARELGVDVVQYGPNLPLDTLPEAELDALLEKAHAWNIDLELCTRGLDLQHLTRQVQLARRIRSPFIRTIPEVGGKPADAKSSLAHLIELLPILKGEGVNLAIENGKLPALELKWLLDEVNDPHFGIVLDTTNSLAVPEGWRYVTEILAPYVMCLHCKEFIIKRAWHMMGFICEGRPTGQGQVDVTWLLTQCERSHFPYNVICELWPPEQPTLQATIDLERAWAKDSIPYLRQFIKQNSVS